VEVKKPQPPKVEKKKEVVRKPPPSRNAARAQVDTQRAERTAASQTSRSQAPSVSPARWQARLAAHLERRKRYPAEARRAREQGTAYVRFTIDTSGNVGSVSLSRSSGYPALDQEVLSLVRRASPVPAPPPGVARTIVVPIRFNMR
jgi:protein TonB